MAAGGGKISASDLDVSTSGASGAAVATDRGGGNISVSGGMYVTRGMNSPGIYSTGTIKVSGGTYDAKGAEAAVVEGANSVTALDASLTGHVNRGVMIYQSMSGDAQGSTGVFSEKVRLVDRVVRAALLRDQHHGTVHLTNVRLSASSGALLDAAAGDWGTVGSNGGTATIDAVKQVLVGAIDVDSISSATLSLADGSSLKGSVNTGDTAKEMTCPWTRPAPGRYRKLLRHHAERSGRYEGFIHHQHRWQRAHHPLQLGRQPDTGRQDLHARWWRRARTRLIVVRVTDHSDPARLQVSPASVGRPGHRESGATPPVARTSGSVEVEPQREEVCPSPANKQTVQSGQLTQPNARIVIEPGTPYRSSSDLDAAGGPVGSLRCFVRSSRLDRDQRPSRSWSRVPPAIGVRRGRPLRRPTV